MDSAQHPLGSFGLWRGGTVFDPTTASLAEQLGFGAVWLGGSPAADLAQAEALLDATRSIVVATGIVNIWRADPAEVAASFHRLESRHPGRFLLGIGSGHREVDAARHSPLTAMSAYLDALDDGGVPVERRIVSALGPKMLRMAGERSLGTHPYLTVPAHTRWARETLGPDALIAPEVTLVPDTDAVTARETGRRMLSGYMRAANYARTATAWGIAEADITDGVADTVVDTLTPWGSASDQAAAVRAHLDAGASHVCAQFLPATADPAPALRALAAALDLTPA